MIKNLITQLPTGSDFDLHRTFGIHLENPTPQDRAAVARQLGLSPTGPLNRPADVTIRFVEHLKRSETLNYLDPDEAGFAEDAFLLLRGKNKTPIRVQIEFDQIGQQCEITCEHGAPAVPLLIPILNLTALAKGFVPVRAAAFLYNGRGTLVTGWAKGGKTSLLLAMMANGAQFVGDEWVYINPEGDCMFGLPEPLHVRDWQLKSLPQYRQHIAGKELRRLQAVRLAKSVEQALSNNQFSQRMLTGLLNRVRPMLNARLEVTVPAQQLFGAGLGNFSAPLDKILLMTNRSAPEITIKRAEPEEIARRITYSLQFEHMKLLQYYHAFHFAFPQRSSPWLEHAERLQSKRLIKLLGYKESYEVFHPSPVDLTTLYEMVCPFVQPA